MLGALQRELASLEVDGGQPCPQLPGALCVLRFCRRSRRGFLGWCKQHVSSFFLRAGLAQTALLSIQT